MPLDYRPDWNIFMVINGVDHVDLGETVVDEKGAEYTIASLPTVNSDNNAEYGKKISLLKNGTLPAEYIDETVKDFIDSYGKNRESQFSFSTHVTWKLFIKINDKEPLQLGTIVKNNNNSKEYTVVRFPTLNSVEYYENMDKGWAADSSMHSIGFKENKKEAGPTVEFFLKNYKVVSATANGDPAAVNEDLTAFNTNGSAVAPAEHIFAATMAARIAKLTGPKIPHSPVSSLNESLPAPKSVVAAEAPQPPPVYTYNQLREMLKSGTVGGKRTKKQKRTKPKSKKRKTNRRR